MRPIREKDGGSQRDRELKAKWGSECAKSNEECERTHQYILESSVTLLDKFQGEMGKYLKKKHMFEKRWQDGEFMSWKDGWLGGREIYKRDQVRQVEEDGHET